LEHAQESRLSLQTRRLTLVPFTAELMGLVLTDRSELARRLSAITPDEWPGPDLAEALPWLLEQRRAQPEPGEWDCLIVHTDDATVIGDLGFKGGPDAKGVAELGYSIIPSYRRQGYAFEAARAAVDWATGRPEISRVVAECLKDNLPSVRVLEKLGFRQTGRDGDLLLWELDR